MIQITIKEHTINIPDEEFVGKFDMSDNGIILDGRVLSATNCAIEVKRVKEVKLIDGQLEWC